MGYKHDQNYFPETYRPQTSPNQELQHEQSPALPPRLNPPSPTSPYLQAPPPYTEPIQQYHSQPLNRSWASQDPRSSSTQSLVPADSGDGKRKLLLIYIHGFLGNDDSFHSFPAHVHNVVAQNLAETHVVHTKIYPRYKSKKAIEHARDDFSDWLHANESINTDVILLGHSMGGLLTAEVVLMNSSNGSRGFRHRIIGTISFDCPFLGMHPGVVVSGIGSLFRPAPESSPSQCKDALGGSQGPSQEPLSNDLLSPSISTCQSTRAPSSNNSSGSNIDTNTLPIPSTGSEPLTPQTSSSPSLPSQDPNYNPPFPNDIRIPVRTGWDNALHFMTKHSNDLTKAAKSVVTSHWEFGACLADYKGLKNRYARLRALENINLDQAGHQVHIRFVNYYTASTGRPKKTKLTPRTSLEAQTAVRAAPEMNVEPVLEQLIPTPTPGLPSSSPRISMEEHHGGEKGLETSQNSDNNDKALNIEASTTSADETAAPSEQKMSSSLSNPSAVPLTPESIGCTEENILPPLPRLPEEPPQFDPADYSEKEPRDLAQKEYSRQTKDYIRAIKEYGKSVKARQRSIEKNEKLAQKESKKKSKLEEKEKIQQSTQEAKQEKASSAATLPSLDPPPNCMYDGKNDDVAVPDDRPEKPKRDKKFCMLPPKANDQLDPCWVRVYMDGVDEVGAHCGLFLVGDHYEWLVNDVGSKITQWVGKE